MRHLRKLALLAALVSLAPVQGMTAGNTDPTKPRMICVREQGGEACFMRTLTVGSTGLTPAQGEAILAAFGLQARPGEQPAVDEFGVFRYIDRDRFQAVPSFLTVPPTGAELPAEVPEDLHLLSDPGEPLPAIDFLNLRALGIELLEGDNIVVGDADAVATVVDGLTRAQVAPSHGTPDASNTTMTFSLNPDSLLPALPGLGDGAEWLLDTKVSFDFALDGIALRGPGAKVSVTLDPEGVVSAAHYALRQLSEGPHRRIIHPSQGENVCRGALGLAPDAPVSAELVYYAPPLQVQASALLPHFDCNVIAEDSDTRPLSRFVPAVAGPTPQITASADGSTVNASVAVQGGTPPYAFDWTSATNGSVGDGSSSVGYAISLDPRAEAGPEQLNERLVVTVTDANGLRASAAALLRVDVPAVSSDDVGASDALGLPDLDQAHGGSHALGPNQVGTWDGTDSPACKPYTDGFRDYVNGSPSPRPTVRFKYSTTWAWESDFKSDTISGGNDHNYVDDIDMAFYCGHGSPDGFGFENSTYGPTDKNLNYTEARWGDRDLEWLAQLSCEVLADTNAAGLTTAQRWGSAFNGLHEMMGFHTYAYAEGNLGANLAFYSQGFSNSFFTMSPWKIHDAFVQAAVDSQPGDVIWATLNPVSYSYTWNRHDYFHDRGAVTADIYANQIYYFVRTSGAA